MRECEASGAQGDWRARLEVVPSAPGAWPAPGERTDAVSGLPVRITCVPLCELPSVIEGIWGCEQIPDIVQADVDRVSKGVGWKPTFVT